MTQVLPGCGRPDEPPELFAAVLSPNRSLSRKGAVLVVGGAGLVGTVMGGIFLLQGAWPVFGFYGLEVLVLWLMLRQNYRDGRVYETVRLTRAQLTVERGDRNGPQGSWSFPAAWLTVSIDEPVHHESQLRLTSHGRSLVVGAFLAPEERADFAGALTQALDRLRRDATAPGP